MEIKGKENYIVITSIFPPTEAVISFAKLANYSLVVVGDKKTPLDWSYANVDYIGMEEQEKMDYELASILPYNHYCRKMLGYLKAAAAGANNIIDTDDDNIPKENWAFPPFEGMYDCVYEPSGFINIYQLFTNQKIWPRGLPLKLISKDFVPEIKLDSLKSNVGIWQGLADEDPDVDAIYRLTSDEPCYFDERKPVVLGVGVASPFNTQNTIVRKELFPLLYLPTYVTFRFTDILRGLVALPIMWLHNFSLGFVGATVVQKRNPHDYMKDFISEIPMYERGEEVIALVSRAITKNKTIAQNMMEAYAVLESENIIEKRELTTLKAWLSDLEGTTNAPTHE